MSLQRIVSIVRDANKARIEAMELVEQATSFAAAAQQCQQSADRPFSRSGWAKHSHNRAADYLAAGRVSLRMAASQFAALRQAS